MDGEAPPEGGCLFIAFENALSENFVVTHARVHLDETPLMDEDPRRTSAERTWILPVAAGRVPDGKHRLHVEAYLAGRSARGVDLGRHRFFVRSRHFFELEPRGTMTIRMVLFEKDNSAGVALPVEERPAVRYVETSPSQGSAGK